MIVFIIHIIDADSSCSFDHSWKLTRQTRRYFTVHFNSSSFFYQRKVTKCGRGKVNMKFDKKVKHNKMKVPQETKKCVLSRF